MSFIQQIPQMIAFSVPRTILDAVDLAVNATEKFPVIKELSRAYSDLLSKKLASWLFSYSDLSLHLRH